MRFNYTLKHGNKIHIDFNYGRNKRFRLSTGEQINDPKNWDKKSQKIKAVIGEPNSFSVNKRLRDLRSAVLDGYDKLLLNNEPIDNIALKEIIQGASKTSSVIKKKKRIVFNELIDDYIQFAQSEKRTRNGKRITKGTLKTYNQAFKAVKEYQLEHEEIQLSGIDGRLYSSLVNYFESKNYSMNSVGKVIAKLKTLFEYIRTVKRIELPNYFKTEWTVQREDIDHIYLTNAELMQLYQMDLSGLSARYERARDLFLIGGFTGLRVSDYNLLTDKNIINHNERSYFRVISKKTSKQTIIPIAPIVFNIMERNNGLPEPMTEQEINRLIKEIGEHAGIDENYTVIKTLGGIKQAVTKPKYEWIMTHTGRRSFCTNAYLGGLDSLSIMAVSGHTTENNFLKYIKVTPMQQAERIAQHPYFQTLAVEFSVSH